MTVKYKIIVKFTDGQKLLKKNASNFNAILI